MNIYEWVARKPEEQAFQCGLTTLFTDTTLSRYRRGKMSPFPKSSSRKMAQMNGFYQDSQMTRSLISGWHNADPFPIEVCEA